MARNECITSVRWGGAPGRGLRRRTPSADASFPSDCGYPSIHGQAADGSLLELNATASLGSDGSSIVLTATHAPRGFVPLATSSGRASWPMPRFYSIAGGLPVLPWHAALNATDPYTPPGGWVPTDAVAVKLVGRGRSCAWVSEDHGSPALAAHCQAAVARSLCNKAASATRGGGGRPAPPPWQAACTAFPKLPCPSEAFGKGLPC